MSVKLGTIPVEGPIPNDLVDRAGVREVAVYASNDHVELVADPSNLSPRAARSLATLLNAAADAAEGMARVTRDENG